jgi:hypothetical protein
MAQRIGAPAIDLDHIHWKVQAGVKREENLATDMVADVASKSRWIVEGVYGWLAAAALPFATSLIWLDMPWMVCSEGLSRRGPVERGDCRGAQDLSEMGRSLLAAQDAEFVRRSPGAVRRIP